MDKNFVSIGCIVLASGISKRFGNENKLTVNFNGKAVIEYILQSVSKGPFMLSVCVTQRTEIKDFCNNYNMPFVMHNFTEKKDTVRIGLDFLLKKGNFDGIMFCVADQPYLTLSTIQKLCDDFKNHPHSIVRAASYDEKGELFQGNPVIFPSTLFEELQLLQDGENGRNVIVKHQDIVRLIPIQDRLELMDIDTPKEIVRIIQENNKKAQIK